ncbi:MAG: hypothetical protein WCI89_01460 [bacterium]
MLTSIPAMADTLPSDVEYFYNSAITLEKDRAQVTLVPLVSLRKDSCRVMFYKGSKRTNVDERDVLLQETVIPVYTIVEVPSTGIKVGCTNVGREGTVTVVVWITEKGSNGWTANNPESQ